MIRRYGSKKLSWVILANQYLPLPWKDLDQNKIVVVLWKNTILPNTMNNDVNKSKMVEYVSKVMSAIEEGKT